MGYLGTDCLDLFQFHHVSQETDFQTLTEPHSGLEGVLRAREGGSPAMSDYGCLSPQSFRARSLTAAIIWGMVVHVPCLTKTPGIAPPGSVHSL